MAIIRKIDTDQKGIFIMEPLDMETCMIFPEKLEELERRVKEVSPALFLSGSRPNTAQHVRQNMPNQEGSDVE